MKAARSRKPVCYGDLADALVNPAAPPYVITLNLYYSGARTARELVNRGAQAALGFLDEIEDELRRALLPVVLLEMVPP